MLGLYLVGCVILGVFVATSTSWRHTGRVLDDVQAGALDDDQPQDGQL